MSDQTDIVIFGATGFTGSRVLAYACACSELSITVAGRSHSRLQSTVKVHTTRDVKVLDGLDVASEDSMRTLAKSAKLVLNCVGPYRHYGEAVVKACVEAGTDYMDVCGEPEFMEQMQLKYDKLARESGCLITSAVGFDSIPAELGAAYCSSLLEAKGLTPHRVESFLLLECGDKGIHGHYATYESAVYGFNSASKLKSLRTEATAAGMNKPATIPGARPPRPSAGPVWQPELKGWSLPFPGADASVVKRTMSIRDTANVPVVHYIANLVIQSRFNLARFVALGSCFSFLAKYTWGVNLLLKLPSLFTWGTFSHAGPTEAQMEETRFLMVFHAYGSQEESSKPEHALTVRVAGPEPGYVATPCFLVEAAKELLSSRAAITKALGTTGGVYSPGAVLLVHGDSYMTKLRDAGIVVAES